MASTNPTFQWPSRPSPLTYDLDAHKTSLNRPPSPQQYDENDNQEYSDDRKLDFTIKL